MLYALAGHSSCVSASRGLCSPASHNGCSAGHPGTSSAAFVRHLTKQWSGRCAAAARLWFDRSLCCFHGRAVACLHRISCLAVQPVSVSCLLEDSVQGQRCPQAAPTSICLDKQACCRTHDVGMVHSYAARCSGTAANAVPHPSSQGLPPPHASLSSQVPAPQSLGSQPASLGIASSQPQRSLLMPGAASIGLPLSYPPQNLAPRSNWPARQANVIASSIKPYPNVAGIKSSLLHHAAGCHAHSSPIYPCGP